MKTEKKFDFTVDVAVLKLENLFAGIEVKAGSKKMVSVILTGTEKFVEKVSVTQDFNNILVSGGTLSEELLAAKNVRCKKTLAITIFVPIGTKVIVSRVQETQICGVRGKIEADINNQAYLSAIDTTGLHLKCCDHAHCNMTNVSGNVTASVIDQAIVSLVGKYELVDICAIDHGMVTLVGSCYELKVNIRGSGCINLNAKIKRR